MTFKQGVSGNPHGATGTARVTCSIRSSCKRCCYISASTARRRLRRSLVTSRPRTSKFLRFWVPREMQIEHTNRIKQMTDEEIEQAIEAIQTMLAARAGEAAKVIEGTAEPAALPAPNRSPEAALEPAKLPKPRIGKVPSPAGT